MWTTLESIVSRFPRHDPNGSYEGGAVVETAPLRSDWDKRMEELEGLRHTQDDWDGQGATAPSSGHLDSAITLAQFLLRHGVDAPSCVVPGVNGTVIFEWQGENGSYLEIEITAPNRVEGYSIIPGKPTEYWTLQ